MSKELELLYSKAFNSTPDATEQKKLTQANLKLQEAISKANKYDELIPYLRENIANCITSDTIHSQDIENSVNNIIELIEDFKETMNKATRYYEIENGIREALREAQEKASKETSITKVWEHWKAKAEAYTYVLFHLLGAGVIPDKNISPQKSSTQMFEELNMFIIPEETTSLMETWRYKNDRTEVVFFLDDREVNVWIDNRVSFKFLEKFVKAVNQRKKEKWWLE